MSISNNQFVFSPLPTITSGFLAFIKSSAADSMFLTSGKITGGSEIFGLLTTLFIGITDDNKLAGKSKYEAPKNKIPVIIVIDTHKIMI